ncbi:hypothetical protein HO504_02025 [Streptococcus suis]|nr:hypothetical protein [Streptococcus suis]
MVWTLKSSDELVELIAEHLGDIEAIKNLETLSMQGYGQYAYMWGVVIYLHHL